MCYIMLVNCEVSCYADVDINIGSDLQNGI